VYSGFNKVLDQQSEGDNVSNVRYDESEWRMFASENDPKATRFLRVRFEFASLERAPAQAQPLEFLTPAAMRSELKDQGAAVNQLPVPTRADKEGPPPPSGAPHEASAGRAHPDLVTVARPSTRRSS